MNQVPRETLLIEALWHIAMQLDDSFYDVVGMSLHERPSLASRLPAIRQFALDMAEGGKRPGFEAFIAEKLDQSA